MKYLLDTSVLLALGWSSHPEHARISRWIRGREVATCAISEIGFLRISAQPHGPFKGTVAQAKSLLADLFKDAKAKSFVADDLPGEASLDTATASTVGDLHLAELAARHGCQFASLDTRIKHPAVVVV